MARSLPPKQVRQHGTARRPTTRPAPQAMRLGRLTVPKDQPTEQDGFVIWGRGQPSTGRPEPNEKRMILPAPGNNEARDLAWADARFATDIFAEHALFFALLMPPEVAPEERRQAIAFNARYAKLHDRIATKGRPGQGEVKAFVRSLRAEVEPLIAYKEENHKAQAEGSLQSLVWPLFFDHTRREAVRWLARLDDIADGHVQLERKEVVQFWGGIMDEHARFVAHLLDPDERDLVREAFAASGTFQELVQPAGAFRAMAREPGMVAKSLAQNPELDAVESAAETILDFKTDAVRKIETGRIRSIISPILADHVRREAVKFVDELRRSKEG